MTCGESLLANLVRGLGESCLEWAWRGGWPNISTPERAPMGGMDCGPRHFTGRLRVWGWRAQVGEVVERCSLQSAAAISKASRSNPSSRRSARLSKQVDQGCVSSEPGSGAGPD